MATGSAVILDASGGTTITTPGTPASGGCEGLCGVTDSFTRTLPEIEVGYWDVNPWGTSDVGAVYEVGADSNTLSGGVTGGYGYLKNPDNGNGFASGGGFLFLTPLPSTGSILTLRLRVDQVSASHNDRIWDTALFSSPYDGGNYSVGWAICNESNFGYLLVSGGEVAKTDWLADTWYTFKFSLISGEAIKGKVWADGEPEPDWMVTGNVLGPVTGYLRLSIMDFPINAQIDFDSIDIGGINPCSEYGFDSFSRVVASGWGTNNVGGVWTVSYTDGTGFPSDGSSSVNGSAGKLIRTTHFTTMSAKTSGPIIDASAGASIAFAFRTNNVGGRADWGGARAAVHEDDLGVTVLVFNWWGPSGPALILWSNRYYYLGHGFFSANTWYEVRYEFDGISTGRAKIWARDTTEPDWMAIEVYPTPYVLSSTEVEAGLTVSNQAGHYVEMDYIDFGWPGKPCYSYAGTAVIDDFGNRTTSGGWGSTSGTTDPWQTSATNGASAFSVNGGVGLVQLAVPGSGYGGGLITVNNGNASYGPPYQVGSGVPESLFAGTSVELSMDVMSTAGGTGNGSVEFCLAAGEDYEGLIYGINSTSIWVGGYHDVYEPPTSWGPFSANTWYTVKAKVEGSTGFVKAWPRGTTEPDWQATCSPVYTLPWPPQEFTINCMSYLNNQTVTYSLDNFVQYQQVGVPPAPVVPAVPGTSVTIAGQGVGPRATGAIA